MIITIWLFNIAMERSTIFKFGKPFISMGHLYHGYVSHNLRVTYIPIKKSHRLWGSGFAMFGPVATERPFTGLIKQPRMTGIATCVGGQAVRFFGGVWRWLGSR